MLHKAFTAGSIIGLSCMIYASCFNTIPYRKRYWSKTNKFWWSKLQHRKELVFAYIL